MKTASLRDMQTQPPVRPDHGIREDRPITVLHDVWPLAGPGQYDMHYELELGIVMQGRMRRDHSGWRKTFSAGDLWLGGIWEPHAAFVLEAPLELAILHIHPSLLARLSFPELPAFRPLSLFTSAPRQRPHPLSKHRDTWQVFARRIVAAGQDRSPTAPIRLHALLLDLLAEIAEHGDCLDTGAVETDTAFEDISRAIEAVLKSEHYLQVGMAAKIAGMNRNLFSRRFRNLMGVSFREFELRHRLGQAARMLRGTDLPLKAIADTLDFTDKSHLHRHFSAVFGQTPQAYREQPRDR